MHLQVRSLMQPSLHQLVPCFSSLFSFLRKTSRFRDLVSGRANVQVQRLQGHGLCLRSSSCQTVYRYPMLRLRRGGNAMSPLSRVPRPGQISGGGEDLADAAWRRDHLGSRFRRALRCNATPYLNAEFPSENLRPYKKDSSEFSEGNFAQQYLFPPAWRCDVWQCF